MPRPDATPSAVPVPTPRRALLARPGASVHAIDNALRSGRTVAPHRGIHVDAEHAGELVPRCLAALATQDGYAAVSHESAAALLAWRAAPEVWAAEAVHLTVHPLSARRGRAGLQLHRRTLLPADVVDVHGVRCTSATRTLIDLARSPRVSRLLVVQLLDAAQRAGHTSAADLSALLERFRGDRHVDRARRLLALSRDGVDSPKETELRLGLWDAGVHEIDVDIHIRDEVDGLLLARADLGVRRLLIWGEYDGYAEHTRRTTFRSDRRGDRWLTRRGWEVLRFTDDDVRRPASVAREWEAAVAAAPARIAALPAGLSPEADAARRALGFA